jgi:hypothetical protein
MLCVFQNKWGTRHSEPYLAAAMLFDVSVTFQECPADVLRVPCV